MRTKFFVLVFGVLFFIVGYASEKTIVLTIDDLPFVGNTHNKAGNLRREKQRFLKILAVLESARIPAVGFVIAGSIEQGQWQLLEQFKEAGLTIGNHTYSHRSLSHTSTSTYLSDINRADEILNPIISQPKFFRYPYLDEGRGQKKQQVYDYLESLNYQIAPVTIDSKDYRFNSRLLSIYWRSRVKYLPKIKHRYLNYIWQSTVQAEKKAAAHGNPQNHVLLIHANLLNSLVLADLIKMYQDRGYKFISMKQWLEIQNKVDIDDKNKV